MQKHFPGTCRPLLYVKGQDQHLPQDAVLREVVGEERELFLVLNSVSWVKRSSVSVVPATDWNKPEVVLDPNYPEDKDTVDGEWHMKYYCVSYSDPSQFRPVSLIFTFAEPVSLCGLKIRGENYSTMKHLPKTMNFSRGDTPDGPWTMVAYHLQATREKGWHMWISKQLHSDSPQALADSARHPDVCGIINESWVNTASESVVRNRAVHESSTEWTDAEPASFYKFDIVEHHSSYIAIAEIDFLAVDG